MMISLDFNILQLEAPRDLLQITDGTPRPEQAVEIANPRSLGQNPGAPATASRERLTTAYGAVQ